MSSVAVFRRRLLGGGEELEEGRVGVETGRTRRALSVSVGVAPPRLEGITARVAPGRMVGSLEGLGERGALVVGRDLFRVGVASSEVRCKLQRDMFSCSSPEGSRV